MWCFRFRLAVLRGIFLVLVAGGATSAMAQLVITATESDGNVEFVYDGLLNLPTEQGFAGSPPQPSVNPAAGAFSLGTAPVGGSYRFGPANGGGSAAESFGTGGALTATSYSGDYVAIGIANPGFTYILGIPSTFVSGSALSGSATFAGQSFVSMGLTPGTYQYAWPAGGITMNIVAVPEPAGVATSVAVGCVGLVMLRRRRKRA